VRKLLHTGEGPIQVSGRVGEENAPRVLTFRDGHAIKQRFIAALNRVWRAACNARRSSPA
jgi:hypothetical protein